MSILFSPITIKQITFRNRVVMPPMVREQGDSDGCVTAAVLENYSRRAHAGTGTLIVEATAVDETSRVWDGGLCAYVGRHLTGLARLAECIHAKGAIALIQLVHGGPQASPRVSGHETVGPSAVRPSAEEPVPRALTVEEIQAIEDRFADAAVLAIEAGFDGVEIHGAHGYLLDSFLSAQRNRRTDAYGGSLEGRQRMLVETCRRIRARIGTQALLDCRISIFNKLSEGFTAADLRVLIDALGTIGLDLLHVSTDGAFKGYFGTQKSIGKWVKEMTCLPIIVAGGLDQPADAERALAEGHADLVAIGSAMLDDSSWTEHARQALET